MRPEDVLLDAMTQAKAADSTEIRALWCARLRAAILKENESGKQAA